MHGLNSTNKNYILLISLFNGFATKQIINNATCIHHTIGTKLYSATFYARTLD